ncbi:palmitoyltransferase [Thraustotheca clavata]|uniref:Palmitoyltransferase n=1 Tax=Thraustotheca clavata TaxID=74557 RepID=A0A1W0A8N2_9STRA|nr:palmitoyltransferase [Thraustotheca clavata]
MTWTDAIFHGVFLVLHRVARCGLLTVRRCGLLFVALGVFMIGFTAGVFMYYILPLITSGIASYWGFTMLTLGILFNILFNYALCVLTDPGKIRHHQDNDEYEFNNDSDEDVEQGTLLQPSLRRRQNQETAYCRKCHIQRPIRAHHCSVCEVCIDHMDHHCPWINNCVGLHNYRYFCTFLFWLAAGCWYSAILSFKPAVGDVSKEELVKYGNVFSSAILELGPQAMMYCVFLIAASAGLLVSFLCGWHFYLVLTAQSSIEYQVNRSKRALRLNGGKIISPYCRGSPHKNWEAVFGPCRFKLLSLLPSRRPTPILLGSACSNKDIV